MKAQPELFLLTDRTKIDSQYNFFHLVLQHRCIMNQTIKMCSHNLLLCFSTGSVVRFQCGASFLMPDLNEQITFAPFCFRVGTANSETCNMPKVDISDETASPVSGIAPSLQVRRNKASPAEHQKFVHERLLTVRALLVRNLFPQIKRLTRNASGRFYNV